MGCCLVRIRVSLSVSAMRLRRVLAYLWALPTTCVGLIFVSLGLISGGRVRWKAGVLEAEGGLVSFFLRRCTLLQGGAAAMTLGHVVLGVDRQQLRRTRAHERVHVRQAERWGPLFLPAYAAASIWCIMRGRTAYFDNPFEREAYAVDRMPAEPTDLTRLRRKSSSTRRRRPGGSSSSSSTPSASSSSGSSHSTNRTSRESRESRHAPLTARPIDDIGSVR